MRDLAVSAHMNSNDLAMLNVSADHILVCIKSNSVREKLVSHLKKNFLSQPKKEMFLII